jgi:predicted nucleic acid-binding Zn ribbon protein
VTSDPDDSYSDDSPSVDDPDASSPHPSQPGSGIDLAQAMLARARNDAKNRPAKRSGPARAGSGRWSDARRSGSGPDERDPELVGVAVERMVADRGWQTARAVGGVEGRWGQIVGPELAEHCRPEVFDDGVLTVQADSTAWATQVRLLAVSVLARLNADLGAGTVTSLRVIGPSGPSWKKGRLSVKGRGPRDTYG